MSPTTIPLLLLIVTVSAVVNIIVVRVVVFIVIRLLAIVVRVIPLLRSASLISISSGGLRRCW